MSKFKRKGQGDDINVVTYNVLSPELGLPDDFYLSLPAAMNPERRFAAVLSKLKPQVSRGAIICLQEVNQAWSGKLYVWFAKRRYRMISSQYHRPFTGNMGVAIAFPIRFDVQSLEYARPTDPPRCRNEEQRPCIKESASPVSCKTSLDYKLRSTINVALFVRLRIKRPKRRTSAPCAPSKNLQHATVCAVTYHFPCEFRDPQYMTAVSGLLLKKAIAFAGGDPLIICGDFNSTPDTAAYGFMTTGVPVSIDKKEDFSTLCAFGENVASSLAGDARSTLSSAYKAKTGAEPEFTNYSRRRLHGGVEHHFCGTIDYIFVSHHWGVSRVITLPSIAGLKVRSYPSEQEPSDHIMIGASLILKNGDTRDRSPAKRVSGESEAVVATARQSKRGTPPRTQQSA